MKIQTSFLSRLSTLNEGEEEIVEVTMTVAREPFLLLNVNDVKASDVRVSAERANGVPGE